MHSCRRESRGKGKSIVPDTDFGVALGSRQGLGQGKWPGLGRLTKWRGRAESLPLPGCGRDAATAGYVALPGSCAAGNTRICWLKTRVIARRYTWADTTAKPALAETRLHQPSPGLRDSPETRGRSLIDGLGVRPRRPTRKPHGHRTLAAMVSNSWMSAGSSSAIRDRLPPEAPKPRA